MKPLRLIILISPRPKAWRVGANAHPLTHKGDTMLKLTAAEIEAVLGVLEHLMADVNNGCDAYLGGEADADLLLSYDDPAVNVLNTLLAKLKGASHA